MFTAAIFDMDGLLIDSERALMRAWMAVAAQMDIPLGQADFARMVGLRSNESDQILLEFFGTEQRVRSLRERARAHLAPAGELPLFPLRPGALELLDRLQQAGVPCAVASSTRRSEIVRRLAGVGVLDRFVQFAGGDEVAASKPDPAVFLLAAKRLQAPPCECLAFEDSGHGVAAALAAGMKVVWVPDLVVPDDMLRTRALLLIESLHDALAHAPQWFAPRTPEVI